MAIVTGDLYKGFTFGGISSKAYGVYITQEAAYNAPDRDVEVVEIAGRNGAYILDKGRFKNITVSYKCGIALDSEHTFESAIRTFRNALSSKAGKYVRLEDDYNVNEFRQAAFLGGIEVEMSDRRAGEFTVSFDAMPQRFLKSGETAVSVASGGTITNPTLFESHPLLQVWGYGDIGINGETISIADDVIGDVQIVQPLPEYNIYPFSQTWVYSVSQVRTDDVLTLGKTKAIIDLIFTEPQNVDRDGTSVQLTSQIESASIGWYNTTGTNWCRGISIFVTISPQNYGAKTTGVIRIPITLDVGIFGTFGDTDILTTNLEFQINYRTVDDTMDISFGASIISHEGDVTFNAPNGGTTFAGITGYSTKSALGEPLYFDLDIGEAYKEEDGTIISVNNAVSFPAQLPVLKSGANTITYDDTVDQFKVVPRWWEV